MIKLNSRQRRKGLLYLTIAERTAVLVAAVLAIIPLIEFIRNYNDREFSSYTRYINSIYICLDGLDNLEEKRALIKEQIDDYKKIAETASKRKELWEKENPDYRVWYESSNNDDRVERQNIYIAAGMTEFEMDTLKSKYKRASGNYNKVYNACTNLQNIVSEDSGIEAPRFRQLF